MICGGDCPWVLGEHPGDCGGADLTLLLSCVFFSILLYLDVAGWEMWNTEGGGDLSFKGMGVMFLHLRDG